MHPDLEQWKAQGEHFDYLGFDVFFVKEGDGPNLLLIHGYPFNSWDWAEIWPQLASRFTAIAPDMLGMGFSSKPSAYEYSVHDHADMHEALLAKLGVKATHVIAHDIGVSVAQEMLARQEGEERAAGAAELQSITWLNGGLFYEEYRPRLVQKLLSETPVGDLVARYNRLLPSSLTKRAVCEMFGPQTKPSEEMLDRLLEVLDCNEGRRVTHKVGRFVNDRAVHRNRWVKAMRETQVPMRFINGPYDPNSGQHMADRYREVIPNADVVLLDSNVGHWPQLEDPNAVVEHFLDHIGHIAGAGKKRPV